MTMWKDLMARKIKFRHHGKHQAVTLINLMPCLAVLGLISCGIGFYLRATSNNTLAAREISVKTSSESIQPALNITAIQFLRSCRAQTCSSASSDENILRDNHWQKITKWVEELPAKDIQAASILAFTCELENTRNLSTDKGEYLLLTTTDFIIAPRSYPGGHKALNEVAWGRVTTIEDARLDLLPYTQAQGRVKMQPVTIDLARILQIVGDENKVLFPWALRLNLTILDRDSHLITKQQAILPIMPGPSNE